MGNVSKAVVDKLAAYLKEKGRDPSAVSFMELRAFQKAVEPPLTIFQAADALQQLVKAAKNNEKK